MLRRVPPAEAVGAMPTCCNTIRRTSTVIAAGLHVSGVKRDCGNHKRAMKQYWRSLDYTDSKR